MMLDALGETLTRSDRNGNVHPYNYDLLGRTTSDAVTTLGTGVTARFAGSRRPTTARGMPT